MRPLTLFLACFTMLMFLAPAAFGQSKMAVTLNVKVVGDSTIPYTGDVPNPTGQIGVQVVDQSTHYSSLLLKCDTCPSMPQGCPCLMLIHTYVIPGASYQVRAIVEDSLSSATAGIEGRRSVLAYYTGKNKFMPGSKGSVDMRNAASLVFDNQHKSYSITIKVPRFLRAVR